MAVFTASQELLGRNLKRIRALLNWSQQKLAEKCNLSTNFISELENGKVWVSAETLDKMCQMLGIDQYRLLLPDNVPEIQTDDLLTVCLDELEAATKKALDDAREKHLKR